MEPQTVVPYFRPASLYVGDLDPVVTETDLWHVFGRVGSVLSVRLCRDRVSGQSLRYGYVNFVYFAHAASAITRLNHTMLKGKPMRIMWSERDPLKRKTGDGNLFVKNLAPSITSISLEKIFCKYGTILSCKVAEDAAGKSKCFGFVQFNSVQSSMAAVDSLNGTMLAGKKLHVSKFFKKNERRDAHHEEPKFTDLYVKNLAGTLSYEFLKDMFSRFGKLRRVRVMKDASGNLWRYGFVNFESHADAKAAMEALNGAQLGPVKLLVDRARNQVERNEFPSSGHKGTINYLNVKNLPQSITDKELYEYFSSLGKVISAEVMRHTNGISKGFGVVHFSTPEEAKKARDAFYGNFFLEKPLYVSKTEPKQEGQREPQSYYVSPHQFHPTYSILPVYPIFNPASYTSFHKSGMYQNSSNNECGMYRFAPQSYQQEGFTYIPVQVQHSQLQKGTYATAAYYYPTQNPNAAVHTGEVEENWNAVGNGRNNRCSACPSKAARCLRY